MTLEHFLSGPNRTNFENRKYAEITGNRVKNDRFRPSRRQNSGIFQEIYLKFCIRIDQTGLSHIYSGFLKIRKFSPLFFKIFFVDYFFTIFKIFKIVKIRDNSLIERFILNLLLKTNCFSLSNCLQDSVSRKP